MNINKIANRILKSTIIDDRGMTDLLVETGMELVKKLIERLKSDLNSVEANKANYIKDFWEFDQSKTVKLKYDEEFDFIFELNMTNPEIDFSKWFYNAYFRGNKIDMHLNLKYLIEKIKDGIENTALKEIEDEMGDIIVHEVNHLVRNIRSEGSLWRTLTKLDEENTKEQIDEKYTREYLYGELGGFEVDARIAQINRRRKNMSQEEWDKISWKEIQNLILVDIYEEFDKAKFLKVWIPRLHREGLLGKKMIQDLQGKF